MERRITPYFIATIVKTADCVEADFEGSIEKLYIAFDAELPEVVEFNADGRRLKTFWTYEEAEEWLNDNL